MTVVGLAQQFDVFDIRRDPGGQRCLRVGLVEAVEAEHLRFNFAPEIGVVAFPAAQVLDDQRFGFIADRRIKTSTGFGQAPH